MIEYREEEIKGKIEELEDENSAFGMYAAQILFNAEAYAA